MIPPERLTVDVMVFRDYVDERDGYAEARALLELHRSGQVELAAASSGYLIDTTQRPGDLWKRLRAFLEEEGIRQTVQLAYPGVMVPSGGTAGAFPDAAVEGFHERWNAALASWPGDEKKPGDSDRLHVETHVLEGRDFFITSDRPLLAMCQRLREDHGLPIEAMRPAEYLASR